MCYTSCQADGKVILAHITQIITFSIFNVKVWPLMKQALPFNRYCSKGQFLVLLKWQIIGKFVLFIVKIIVDNFISYGLKICQIGRAHV